MLSRNAITVRCRRHPAVTRPMNVIGQSEEGVNLSGVGRMLYYKLCSSSSSSPVSYSLFFFLPSVKWTDIFVGTQLLSRKVCARPLERPLIFFFCPFSRFLFFEFSWRREYKLLPDLLPLHYRVFAVLERLEERKLPLSGIL